MFDQSTLAQVDDKAKQYMNNPQALQQMYQQKQQLIDLLALQKIKSEKEAAARDMQLQMSAQSGQPQTIAQQREQQVLDMTKQEMVGQRAGTLGQQQQEQQRNLQQVLKGMSQGAPQPPQQGTPGVPQQGTTRPQSAPPQVGGQPGQPGLAALPTQGLMPPKAMAAGGIVAFSGEEDSYVGLPDWEEEWKKRQEEKAAKGTGKEVPRSWWERNVVNPDENRYALARDIEARRIDRANKSGVFTPQTDAEREAEKAKDAIVANLKAGKYDPTGKPLVPMIGKEKQSDVFARMEEMKKPPAPAPNTQADPALVKPKPQPKPRPDAASNLNLAAPVETMPQAPAGGLQSIVEGGVKKQIGRDPVAEAAAKRAEAAKSMGYTDAEKAKFEANQAGLEALNKAQMDPEKLRQQQLEDFLLGAAGHSTMGITLGSAGKAAVGRERMQDALKYGRMGELAKRGEDYMESGRKAREEGFKVGEKAGEQAEMGTRQGIASGASMVDKDKELVNAGLDRKSREYIARLSASVQHEANTASKEGNLLAKYQTILGNATKNEEAAISRIQKESPDGKLLTNLASMEAFGKLDKDQIAQKNAASARLEAQVIAVRNKFAEDRDMVMSLVNSVGGGSGLGGLTGGNKGWGKVEEVKPTKK